MLEEKCENYGIKMKKVMCAKKLTQMKKIGSVA